MVDRLTRRVAQLAEHPRSGRIVEKYQREDLPDLAQQAQCAGMQGMGSADVGGTFQLRILS